MRRSAAASIAGPEAYPPTLITTSGLNRPKNPAQCRTARGRSNIVFSRVTDETFFNAPTWISSSGYPACGTKRVSMPREVPMNTISAPWRSRNSFAIASAGITCPPVPPPAKTVRMIVLRSLVGLLRDVQQHADAHQHNEQRRSTVRDKRQRDAFGRQQRQHY